MLTVTGLAPGATDVNAEQSAIVSCFTDDCLRDSPATVTVDVDPVAVAVLAGRSTTTEHWVITPSVTVAARVPVRIPIRLSDPPPKAPAPLDGGCPSTSSAGGLNRSLAATS